MPSTDLGGHAEQAEVIIEHGLHEVAGLSAAALRSLAASTSEARGLLVLAPDLVPAPVLAAHVRHGAQRGFIVADMTDLDRFTPIRSATPPPGEAYAVLDPTRGDELTNWSPNEALGFLLGAGRSPLTVTEGLWWLIQQPEVLERNRCFMTIGSRLTRADGSVDARTPALWISNGTGRDGPARKNAPKVGWCWAGNRHSWLGFASTSGRSALSR